MANIYNPQMFLSVLTFFKPNTTIRSSNVSQLRKRKSDAPYDLGPSLTFAKLLNK
jgi:hypothetical protein